MTKDDLMKLAQDWRNGNPRRINCMEVGAHVRDTAAEVIRKAKAYNNLNIVDDTDAKDLVLTNAFMSEAWVVGGRTGGDCWGGAADRPRTADEAPALWELDEFLEQALPTINYLQYKRLIPKIGTIDYYVSEYYGNSYEYRVQFLLFDDLVEVLGTD